jgi:predicted tellurium resistance membrane protein TerC
MMFAARPIGDFVDRHPSVKMLALSFLILVGFTLMLESFDVHVPKGIHLLRDVLLYCGGEP